MNAKELKQKIMDKGVSEETLSVYDNDIEGLKSCAAAWGIIKPFSGDGDGSDGQDMVGSDEELKPFTKPNTLTCPNPGCRRNADVGAKCWYCGRQN